MFIEIEKTAQPTSLHRKLVQDVLASAGIKIKNIDDNRCTIAECETLAERLNAHGLNGAATPSVTLLINSVVAHVAIFDRPIAVVRDAIKRAGLHIYKEEVVRDFDWLDGGAVEMQFELSGLDCTVIVNLVDKELAEAA